MALRILALLAVLITTARAADEPLRIANDRLVLTFNRDEGTFSVEDRAARRTWIQKPADKETAVTRADLKEGRIAIGLRRASTKLDLEATIRLEGAEAIVTLNAAGPMPRAIAWPHPFVSEAGTYLVVPMNEGISYPVDDETIDPMRLIAYGGHGICMAFWGVTDGSAGHMAILQTADDAAIRMRRIGQTLCIHPEWEAQKKQFGYERTLRYVFFDSGGHVAMCKRYRTHAEQQGLVRTFTEKRKDRPAIDRLIGAANIWCRERDALEIVRELKSAGIDRILWSNRARPEEIAQMNKDPLVLASRYDIYQDVMDPAKFPLLRGVHGDWPADAWPKDLLIGAGGDWVRGWQVRARDGSMIPCGVVCDRQAVAYAQKRIGEELKTHPYLCRFLDTTTASPWRECYDKAHPMTRTQSRQFKMKLLATVSDQYKLVCGCETGHDASVPFVDYFEGMLSLGPYRVPDSGRDMQRMWDEIPPRVQKFQVGWKYRLPLWELVYHDCVVAQWYWGDYNNKLPALWDLRDLFNALYGTPPMFMFSRDTWQKHSDRFVASYRMTAPIARATGYSAMVDHRFLAKDRSVQQTRFANGVVVTVNFGDAPFRMEDGTTLPPRSHRIAGL